MKAEHTKGLLERNAIKGWELWIGADYHIADVHGQLDIRRANALRMITCWNSHDKLLEVCTLLKFLTICGRAELDTEEHSLLDAAIAEAEKVIIIETEKENG